MSRVLVVDDEASMRRSLAIMLQREGFTVTDMAGGAQAIHELRRHAYDVVITDLRMGAVSGLELLRDVKREHPDVEVILKTAYGTVEGAVEAMKLGAFDFVTKPFQMEELLLRVRNAVDKRRLTERVRRLESEVERAAGGDAIVGESAAIRALAAKLDRVAPTDSNVLVTGESGTGKELVARAIHARSRRARQPFVAVSCAAVPEALLESELFGHAAGAFTGARAARRGLLEEAHGGTFFLDEVGEAPPAIQAKLLRALEERAIRRLGDNRVVAVDVRVVAATNRNLATEIAERRFREDLYYRLNVIALHLPPLRERREDVALLAAHFLRRHAARARRYVTGFSVDALARLDAYAFPGNVRELSNVVEQAGALASGAVIEAADLALPAATAPARPDAGAPPPLRETGSSRLARMERDLIVQLIDQHGGNLAAVAEELGISRTTLWRRMKDHGIETRRTAS
jgi:two-component system response regulator HydG